jgi:hypothetical protein
MKRKEKSDDEKKIQVLGINALFGIQFSCPIEFGIGQ